MDKEIIKRLTEQGHEALYVGGMVRDYLLGIEINDIDIATSASPDEMKEIFNDCHIDEVGKNFGVMIVKGIEVATFRSEEYEVQSKPQVKQVKTFYEDASRRDFTINAMGMTANSEIVDYFNGQEDIKNNLIRAVGNPDERFTEDPSRILRALYLASRLGFSFEKNTLASIRKNSEQLDNVPNELKGKIIRKVMKYNCLSTFVCLAEYTGILPYIFPEIAHTVGLKQNPEYHHLDVFGHIVKVIEAVEQRPYEDKEVMYLSAILHDNAKGLDGIRGVNNRGLPNDLGHEEAGVSRAKAMVKRLGFGKDVARNVGLIVGFHGVRLPENPKTRSLLKVIRKIVPYCKDKGQLKRTIEQLYQFMYCDSEGFTPEFSIANKTNLIKSYVGIRLVLDGYIFYRSELPIDGKYLMDRGYTGKEIGDVLDTLVSLDMKTKEQIDNYLNKRKNF